MAGSITINPIIISFDLSNDFSNNIKNKIDYKVKRSKFLAKHAIKKKKLDKYYPNIIMETVFMNTENSKINEPHTFVINMSQKLDV